MRSIITTSGSITGAGLQKQQSQCLPRTDEDTAQALNMGGSELEHAPHTHTRIHTNTRVFHYGAVYLSGSGTPAAGNQQRVSNDTRVRSRFQCTQLVQDFGIALLIVRHIFA